MSERMLAAARRDEDQGETSLRPQTLTEFIGQPKVCANLKVFIEAARGRREALDHVLFAGPPGLGKTTLAQIVGHPELVEPLPGLLQEVVVALDGEDPRAHLRKNARLVPASGPDFQHFLTALDAEQL